MLPEFMLPELNLTETAVTVVNAWISAHPSYALEVVFSCLNQKKAYDYLVEQATGYAWLNEGVVKKIVQKIGCCQRLIPALYIRLASDDLDPAYREEFERIKNWLVFEYTPPYLYTLYHVWNNQTTYRPATFWPRAPRISQINRPIGDCVFGPFPEVAHPLHEKSAKDGALCKRDKKRTGNLWLDSDKELICLSTVSWRFPGCIRTNPVWFLTGSQTGFSLYITNGGHTMRR